MNEDDDFGAARGCGIALIWCALFWIVLIGTFLFW